MAFETFWGGVAAADKRRAELAARAGVGISMGSVAAITALKAFGARRFAVLTPHQPRDDEIVRAYLAEAGFEIVRLKGEATDRGVECASFQALKVAGPVDGASLSVQAYRTSAEARA
jgi:maleate isomerase